MGRQARGRVLPLKGRHQNGPTCCQRANIKTPARSATARSRALTKPFCLYVTHCRLPLAMPNATPTRR